jgi:hypothetical protein
VGYVFEHGIDLYSRFAPRSDFFSTEAGMCFDYFKALTAAVLAHFTHFAITRRPASVWILTRPYFASNRMALAYADIAIESRVSLPDTPHA